MKRKMWKSVVVLVCMIMFFPILESGKEIKAEELRYQYVNDAECSISITSVTATITSNVYGKSGTTSTSVTVYLESYYNGEWHSYNSWTHTGGKNQENTDTTTVGVGIYHHIADLRFGCRRLASIGDDTIGRAEKHLAAFIDGHGVDGVVEQRAVVGVEVMEFLGLALERHQVDA